MKLLRTYLNGNYWVDLYEDGTKVRRTVDPKETVFKPKFPESIDVTITKYCDGGCPWCYMGCDTQGKHGDLMDVKFLNSLHFGTEVAINGNDLSHPDLEDFLYALAVRGVIANITVNAKHFMRPEIFKKLYEWSEKKYIYGVGVSYDREVVKESPNTFVGCMKLIPHTVLHTIAGLFTKEDVCLLLDHGGEDLKVLVLGYKHKGRGDTFFNTEAGKGIQTGIDWLKGTLDELLESFEIVSFDNLGLEQLDVLSHLTEDEKNTYYMGDEGQFTFYVNLVDRTFARSSMEETEIPVGFSNMDVKKMFRRIQNGE